MQVVQTDGLSSHCSFLCKRNGVKRTGKDYLAGGSLGACMALSEIRLLAAVVCIVMVDTYDARIL